MRKGGDKLRIAMGAKQQGRLDGFFKAAPTTSSPKDVVNPARAKRLVGSCSCFPTYIAYQAHAKRAISPIG